MFIEFWWLQSTACYVQSKGYDAGKEEMWCVKFVFISINNNNNIVIIIIILLLCFFNQSQTWTKMLWKVDVAMLSFKIKLLKALGNYKYFPFP